MTKTASLTAGLVKKGEAAPAPVVSASAAPAKGSSLAAKAADSGSGTDYYKSLTVKLNKPRYLALKTAGVQLDKTSQEILVEALDLWLKSAAAD